MVDELLRIVNYASSLADQKLICQLVLVCMFVIIVSDCVIGLYDKYTMMLLL